MTEINESTAFIRSAMPLCDALDIEAVSVTPTEVVLRMAWAAERCTSNGLLHGGALMALADSAGAACAFSNLPDGAAGTTTIESKTNFFGAVTAGHVTATARPLHVGATTIVIETEIRHDDRLVAKVTQTQMVLRPRS